MKQRVGGRERETKREKYRDGQKDSQRDTSTLREKKRKQRGRKKETMDKERKSHMTCSLESIELILVFTSKLLFQGEQKITQQTQDLKEEEEKVLGWGKQKKRGGGK